MAEHIRVGKEILARSQFSTPIGWALDAYEEVGDQAWLILNPKVRAGPSIAMHLPEDQNSVITVTTNVLDVAIAVDAQNLDDAPEMDLRYGRLPTSAVALDKKLTELHGRSDDEAARLLLAAAAQLLRRIEKVRDTWRARCEAVAGAVLDVELVANELYAGYLHDNRAIAVSERARYLSPGRVPAPRVNTKDHDGLVAALSQVAALRAEVKLDQIRRVAALRTAVSVVVGAAAVVMALQRGVIYPDRQELSQLALAAKIRNDGTAAEAEATAAYLVGLREAATSYPIVTVAGPLQLTARNSPQWAAELDRLLRTCEESIDELLREGAAASTMPTKPEVDALTPAGLARRAAGAGRVTAWKLPFFIDRAIGVLPPRLAEDVASVRRLAAELDSSGATKSALAFAGMDLAMLGVAAAGPIGIGLAMVWGLVELGVDLAEYEQLQKLFHATLDPTLLLLDVEHGPASALAVVLDLVGVLIP
ncbi:hypothetical protein [Kineococcus sp. SYSU DK005]|uniref:hypothetical protein n=1 Tax=Kineococcus sp. SYSU DK005 TaxID=3383126 RepID=UPI003D7C8352